MYGVTWKQVWVKRSTCSVTAATTRGALLPRLVTEMPDARSIRRFPSTSSMIPPPARATNTPRVVATPAGTAATSRRGPRRRRTGTGLGAVDGGGVDFVGAHVGTVHEMRHALDPGTG